MYRQIQEGSAICYIPSETKISKELPVFYNPIMKFNRDLSVLLLNSHEMQDMQIGLPLAGTGIRGIRFHLELDEGKAQSIHMNDISPAAQKLMHQNVELNKADCFVHNKDANMFLLESKGFDYIDIDPFGSPNPFLDSSVKRLSRSGILAVTATDTSALCGTFPKACERKYWAKPIRTEIMHEAGIRILIRKVQLVGAQFEKALIPIYSYSKDHYMRVFFQCRKGKKFVDDVIDHHRTINPHFPRMYFPGEEANTDAPGTNSGPMWDGPLWDASLAEKMLHNNTCKENQKFLELINGESKINALYFYEIHSVIKRLKLKSIMRKKEILDAIICAGFNASETHFSPTGIRSDIPYEALAVILSGSP